MRTIDGRADDHRANLTNNVSDGDVTFTNSGVFTIGGQNTSGTNTYANPIILGWTANRGKSVTLVAATGGEVDFTGGIRANGTDTTAGITVGDATHGGIVRIRGTANTYAGTTTVSNGTLIVSGTVGNGAVAVAGGTMQVSGTAGNGPVTVSTGHCGPAGRLGLARSPLAMEARCPAAARSAARQRFRLAAAWFQDKAPARPGQC